MRTVHDCDGAASQQTLTTALLAHWEIIALPLLFIAGFLLRALPILEYPHVGGDPFLHYRFAIALLEGKLSVPVEVNSAGTSVAVYYPPLFHLLSLGFFLAFPTVDPYVVMKVLAATFGALQVVPIYLIARRVSHTNLAALLASYSLLTVRSDYQMLSWGGYANIAGLFLIAVLIYCVMTEKLILSAIVSAALALTHHLSLLLIVAVLVPYFMMSVWNRKTIPKALVGLIVGGGLAYLVFYRFALFPIVEFYSKFSPAYDQSLYVTPYILEQVGPLLLLFGALGVILSFAYPDRAFAESRGILVIWAIVPLFLAYAYLFGVQWHGVRWIHFIPQPLTVWAGIALGYLAQKKLLLVIFAFLFTLQLIGTIQGYYSDILRNVT